MINKKEYWEQCIAFAVLVFAIYPFTKDYVDEPALAYLRMSVAQFFANSMFYDFITRSIAAYFLALLMAFISVNVLELYINYFKKRDVNKLKKQERI